MSRESRVRTVPDPVWVQVVTNADGQCQCETRKCHTPAARDRCKATSPGVRLVAAPADPLVPEWAAWRVPVEGLSAWCPSCLAAARRRGEAARVEAARVAGTEAQAELTLALDPAPGDATTSRRHDVVSGVLS